MQNVGLFALALVFGLAACGGGGGTPPPNTTPVFTSLVVSPANPDLVEGDTLQLTATPRDQTGANMSGLPAATFVLTSGTSVSVTTSGRVIALAPGNATVTATLTSGGTTKTATSTPSVDELGLTASVTASGAGATFTPDTVKIAVNGTVTWSFPGPETHNVDFASAQIQDIGDHNSGSEQRQFAAVGRFSYQCTRHAGMNGAVVVRAP